MSYLSYNTFNVSIKAWNGPLDLLLDLIHNAKISIYDIPINEITNQYLETINLMKKVNIDIASDFLIMASRLIYIKSKMLLPIEYQEKEDSSLFLNSKQDLIDELIEYQKFKNIATKIEHRQDHQKYIIERKNKQTTFIPHVKEKNLWKEINLLDVIKIFYDIIEDIDKKPPSLESLRDETFSVEDKINTIKELFKNETMINFHDLFISKNIIKEEIIVTLWAILELYKQSFIVIKQHSLFSDIYLFKKKTSINQ